MKSLASLAWISPAEVKIHCENYGEIINAKTRRNKVLNLGLSHLLGKLLSDILS